MADTKPMILTVDDIRQEAAKRLDRVSLNFFNDGAGDMTTLSDNATAFAKYRVRPRVLRDVSGADPSARVLGRNISFPLCVSPAGLQAMAHRDGELATARACARRGVHMGVSSYANHSVADITAAGGSSSSASSPFANGHVMQMYTMRDRALASRMLSRAEAAGCLAVFLTADSPVLGIRRNEWRDDFRTPGGLEFPNAERTTEVIQAETHEDGFTARHSDAHCWAREIPWLRSQTSMQIWVKGVLTGEDVVLAREHGCDGVVVSNHGGRQLDGAPATMDVLAECVRAAEGKIPVHVDSGFRSGTDIFKAIALGAQCCWVGRPAIWGLAYDGEKGVDKMLDILYDEFKRCMMLAGCSSVSDITTASLGLVQAHGPLAKL